MHRLWVPTGPGWHHEPCSCREPGALQKWAEHKRRICLWLASSCPRGSGTASPQWPELFQEPWPCALGSNHSRAKQNSSVDFPEVSEHRGLLGKLQCPRTRKLLLDGSHKSHSAGLTNTAGIYNSLPHIRKIQWILVY